jgi:hypothetical protein
MLACLGKLWLGWWKCRAYADMLGQDVAELGQM